MTRPLAVLRPEPGNAATAARIEALGLAVLRMPLFEVRATGWTTPDAHMFDALLLTSASAVRHGGAGLRELTALPVYAVGDATARAAEDAGFTVAAVGRGGVEAIAAQARGKRLLHLAGREHRAVADATTIVVYASEPLPIDATRLHDTVALAHSPRAARRLADHVDRARVRLAAISLQAAAAASPGWADVAVAELPTDAALIAAARRLAD